MATTILGVLKKFGHKILDVSTLKETRGLFIADQMVFDGDKLFNGEGYDLSGSVFYRCELGEGSEQSNALTIDCKVSKELTLKIICERFRHQLFKLNEGSDKVLLRNADLQSADLQGAKLWDVDMQGANLQGANLQGANMWEIDLQRAYLQGADLKYANLFNANLQGANLQGANLEHANLWEADLRGANLVGANLRLVKIGHAIYNSETKGLTEEQLSAMDYDHEYDD